MAVLLHIRGPVESIILLSEIMPPAFGGSAVLFDQIYSRVRGADITALTRGRPPRKFGPVEAVERSLEVFEEPWAWGVLGRKSLRQYWDRALRLRSISAGRRSLVHCGRALPEGLTALMARVMSGPRYLCWTHGEELAYAASSRELALLTRCVHRGAAAVCANSWHTAGMLEDFGVPRRKISVIHPGVDPVRFRPDVDGRDLRHRLGAKDDLLLLSVGRLQRRKGHDVVLAAMQMLLPAFPRLRYVIAGDGAERARLEALAAVRGLADRVVFAGAVPEDALPSYYAACDVFVLPNRVDNGDLEGFGIVFLEAAASGKPVIGGCTGGVPEAIEHGCTGLLVEGRDVDAVAGAIRRLAISARLRRQMGAAGRARVLQSFTWDAAASALSALHERLTHRLGPPQ
jgi:phosphatidylinositol alpha-1,6-mannosyltransferase